MLDLIKDLHLTVQNMVAGIALISQNSGDKQSLKWVIKNGSNQPTVIISYNLTCDVNVLESDMSRMEYTTSNVQNDEFHENNEESRTHSHVSEDEVNNILPHHSVETESNKISSFSTEIFEPEVCIKIERNSPEVSDESFLNCSYDDGHNVKFVNSDDKTAKANSSLSEEIVQNSFRNIIKEEKDTYGVDFYEETGMNKACAYSFRACDKDSFATRNDSCERNHGEAIDQIISSDNDCKYETKSCELMASEMHIIHTINSEDHITNSSSNEILKKSDLDILVPEVILKAKELKNMEYVQNLGNENLRETSQPSASVDQSVANNEPNTRIFVCNYCGKNFKLKNDLVVHRRIHTGEKPYSCSYCGRCFRDMRDRKRHERVHTGEKPYVCRHCNRRFARNHHKTRHERTHTGEKPYSCDYCGKSFTQFYSKRLHEENSCKQNVSSNVEFSLNNT